MRDVFGTRLRRAEDVFPPVIELLLIKGRLQNLCFCSSCSGSGSEGITCSAREGNDPEEQHRCITAGCQIFIFMQRILSFLLSWEKDDVTYAIKPTCWHRLDIIPSCLALHRIETELMGKFDEGKLPTDPHLMLRLAIETVAHDYDVIVIDSA